MQSKRSLGSPLVLFILSTFVVFTSCSGNPPLSNAPAINTTIMISRSLARVGIAAELKRRGASDAVVTATLDDLHKAVDKLLDGESVVAIVSDPAAWADLRAIGVKQLAAIVTRAVPAIDEATAEMLIGQLFDAAKAYVQERTKESAAAHEIDNRWPSGAEMARYYRNESKRDPAHAQQAEMLALIEEALDLSGRNRERAAIAKLQRCRQLAAHLSGEDRQSMIEVADFWIEEISTPAQH